MKKAGIFVIGILLLSGIFIYYKLGGFNEIRITREDCREIRLIGKTYEGTPQDEKLGHTFQEIHGIVEKENAVLNTVYYVEPAGKLDTMKVFVGLPWQVGLQDKYGLELLEISCGKMLKASIQASRLVMPGPGKVKKRLSDFAKSDGAQLQGIYVDQIISEDRVYVLAPLE